MFKTLTSATAIALALSVGSALAADLPSYKAPPYVPPPPLMTWTGFYIGLNAGGTFGGSNAVSVASFSGPCSPTVIGCTGTPSYGLTSSVAATFIAPASSTGGFIGGGQIGYNWQFGNNFVVGVEADIQGVAGNRSTSTFASAVPNGLFPAFPLVQSATVSRSLDYLGTVRGRLGFLFTPSLLVYGTGGLAYGGVNSRVGIFQTFAGDGTVTPLFGSGAFSDTRVGWTVGGGGEWMFLPNWSAKIEYLYYDLGSVTYAVSPLVTTSTITGVIVGSIFPQARTRFDGHIVRAGLNYHFNWGAPAPAVYAKY
jgi:outer membrane immunogenic protein